MGLTGFPTDNAEGFAVRSAHYAPVLRTILDSALGRLEASSSALALAGLIKKIRPELDLYVTSDRDVETHAASPGRLSPSLSVAPNSLPRQHPHHRDRRHARAVSSSSPH